MKKNNSTFAKTISAEELASLASLTKRRLYQLAADDKIPAAVNGRFPMPDAVQKLFAVYQQDWQQLSKEKLLKVTAERKALERENEIAECTRNDTWITREESRAILTTVIRRLEQLPANLRSQFGLTDEQTEGIRRKLDELRTEAAAEVRGMGGKR